MSPAFPLCSLSIEHMGRNVLTLNMNPNARPNGHDPQRVFTEAKALSSEEEQLRSLHKTRGTYRKILFSVGWAGFFLFDFCKKEFCSEQNRKGTVGRIFS